MSRGNRRDFLTIGIVAATLIALLMGAFLIVRANLLEATYEHRADQKAGAYADRANIAIESRCRALPATSQPQCVHEEREAARQGARAERELEAQTVTVIWTKYTDISVILGTSAGIVGLALILATFWQNKRSADAAHDANRPWIEISVEDLELIFESAGGTATAFAILTNHGNSPATNVVARAAWVAIPRMKSSKPGTLLTLISSKLDQLERGSIPFGKTMFPNKPAKEAVAASLSPTEIAEGRGGQKGSIRFLFAVGVTYDVSDRRGRTVKTYNMTVRDAIDYGAENVTHLIKPARIILEERMDGYAT